MSRKTRSARSRGDRLVRIEKDSQGFIIWLKMFNKKEEKFKATGFWWRSDCDKSLEAAEEWLKGAKV